MGLIEQMDALPEDSNEGLELLRVYRMIDDMANRKVKIPEQWMTKYLQKNYPKNQIFSVSLWLILAMQWNMQIQISVCLSKKIADKQQEYSKLPLADRVYQNFKNSGKYRTAASH